MSGALASSAAVNRDRAIIAAALLGTFMEAVNISIPNAALPYIQGTVSMADDEVGPVFTAYIAAIAGPGLAALNEMITRQAVIVAVIGQFKISMSAMLIVSTLVLFLREQRPAN